MRLSFKQCFLFLGIGLLCCVVTAQDLPKNEELKLQINELLFQEDVEAVNTLLNENKLLTPEYKLDILTQNLAIAERNNNPKELSSTYTTLGTFWFEQGNRVKAYDYYFKSETISRKVNDPKRIGLSLLHKGNVSSDPDSRISTYQEAIKVFKEVDDTLNLAKVYLNLGDVYANYYWAKHKTDSLATTQEKSFYKENTFKYYALADSLNTYINEGTIGGIVKTHYGEWYKQEQKYEAAKKEFIEAEAILEKAAFPKGQTYCTLHIASIEIKQGNFNEALQYLAKAEILSKKYDFKNYLQGVYDEYVKVYDSIGNLQKALYYNKLYTSVTIDLYTINSQDKIHALNLEHNLTENTYKIEKYQAQSRLNKVLLTVAILLLILIGSIAYLIIKNKKRKIDSVEKSKVIAELEKSSMEIKLKNQQLHEELLKEKVKFSQDNLMNFANQITKIEDFLSKLSKQVKGLSISAETREEINALKLSFSDVLNGQKSLKRLNSLSTQLNQEFFFYIKQQFPSISKGDEQLLAFIILDMSSKEISQNLNISTDSVYIKRYRLRKKLHRAKNESIADFYERTLQHLNTV